MVLNVNNLREQLSTSEELSAKEISNLKSDHSNAENAKEALEAEVKSKSMVLRSAQAELSSMQKSFEENIKKYTDQVLNLEDIIKVKDKEINELNKQLASSLVKKRKLSAEEEKVDVRSKKTKICEAESIVSYSDTEESLDYMPSDEETGIDEVDCDNNGSS